MHIPSMPSIAAFMALLLPLLISHCTVSAAAIEQNQKEVRILNNATELDARTTAGKATPAPPKGRAWGGYMKHRETGDMVWLRINTWQDLRRALVQHDIWPPPLRAGVHCLDEIMPQVTDEFGTWDGRRCRGHDWFISHHRWQRPTHCREHCFRELMYAVTMGLDEWTCRARVKWAHCDMGYRPTRPI